MPSSRANIRYFGHSTSYEIRTGKAPQYWMTHQTERAMMASEDANTKNFRRAKGFVQAMIRAHTRGSKMSRAGRLGRAGHV